MKRWPLIVLLAAGIVCAGIGVQLTGNPFQPAKHGWTAYAPLSGATYRPVDVTWLVWAPRIGVVLLALGAGCAGAALAALVLLQRGRIRARPAD
ncbi:hypothetical protein GCM10025783_16600 [Amnibacterium soli]|uniref:Uncharacterized protein n=1 Tax=Amnibacterium soli TaxID=1282736 RepID=A0ABP8Z3C4_9MICO